MQIPFVENDVSEGVETIIFPDAILSFLRKRGLLESESTEYAEACYNMCNLFSLLIGKELLPFCEPNSLMVYEGSYGRQGNHTWLVLEDTIIDATLLQFDNRAKKLNFIDVSFEEYFTLKKYTFEDWMENSPNML